MPVGGGVAVAVTILFLALSAIPTRSFADPECTTFEYSDQDSIFTPGSRAYFNHYGNPPDSDEDMDFINDNFEYAIADYFNPRLWCYESDYSCWGGEPGDSPMPTVLFQVSPIDCKDHGDDYPDDFPGGYDFEPILPRNCSSWYENYIHLAITYEFLWEEDTGLGEYDYSYLDAPEHFNCYGDCTNCDDNWEVGCNLHATILASMPSLPLAVSCLAGCLRPYGIDPPCVTVCTTLIFVNPIIFFPALYGCMREDHAHCHCMQFNSHFEDSFDLVLGEFSYHSVLDGSHFGDNNFLRAFVRSHTADVTQWELIGIQNDTKSKIPYINISDCASFDTSGRGCHPNVYFSHGKKHQNIIHDRLFENDYNAYCTLGDSCSGDHFETDTPIIGSLINSCGECFHRDEMRSFPAAITHDLSPDGYNEVGAVYDPYPLDEPSDFEYGWRIEDINYLNEGFFPGNNEHAWNYKDESGTELYFCGRGERRDADNNCCRPYYTWGEEDCDTLQSLQTARAVGKKWLRFIKESDFDADAYTGPDAQGSSCFPMGIEGIDYNIIGNPDHCPDDVEIDNCPVYPNDSDMDVDGDTIGESLYGRICDNCPYLDAYNPYQEDSDGDGVGDVCDLCPHNPRIDWDYVEEPTRDMDFDRLDDFECDLCPGSAPPGGLVNRYQDDPYHPDRLDYDGDGVGDRCDNCPFDSNQYQENCNLEYEILWGFENGATVDIEGAKGDLCDPDPCVDVMQASFFHYFEKSRDVHEHETVTGRRVTANFDLKGYSWDPLAGENRERKRWEALEVLWCSPWNTDYNEWDDMNSELYCLTDGEEHKDWDTRLGWWGIIRDTNNNADSMAITNPGEDDDADAETYSYGGYSYMATPIEHKAYKREFDSFKNYQILWQDGRILYPTDLDPDAPPEIDHHLQHLTYWFRPIHRAAWEYRKEKIPPWSHRFQDPEDPRVNMTPMNWNNTYTPVEEYITGIRFIGFADIDLFEGESDVRNIAGIGRDPSSPVDPRLTRYADQFLFNHYNECPSYPWDFEECEPDSAILGLPILKFNHLTRTFMSFEPSRPLQQEVPKELGMAVTSIPFQFSLVPDEPTGIAGVEEPGRIIYGFGGFDANATYSSKVWRASELYYFYGQPDMDFYWERLDVPDTVAPQGRANAGLFMTVAGAAAHGPPIALMNADEDGTLIPGSEPGLQDFNALLVFGGENELDYFNDGWVFDVDSRSWSPADFSGDIPSPRSRFSSVQAWNEVYIFGGVTSGGISSEVFRLSLDTLTFELILDGTGGPGPRINSSIVHDYENNTFYLYGGHDGSIIHNDLWFFDPSSGQYAQLVPDCEYGQCPPLSTNGQLLYDPYFNIMTLVTFYAGDTKDFYWVPSDSGWISQQAFEGLASEGDCDLDGSREQDYGKLCPTGDEWWSYPGRKVCDTQNSTLVCAPETIEILQSGRVRVPGATAFSIAGNQVWVTRGNVLEGYDISNLPGISKISSLSLPHHARDVAVAGNIAFVAEGHEVAVIDVSDPFHPVFKSSFKTCGKALEVAVDDYKLAVLSKGGVGLLAVLNEEEIYPGGFLRISPFGADCMTPPETMDACGELAWWEQMWMDIFTVFPTANSALDIGKNAIFAAGRRKIIAISSSEVSDPYILSTVMLPRPIKAMQYDRDYVYVNLRGRKTALVDVTDTREVTVAGTHEVGIFAKGLTYDYGRVVFLHRPHLLVAEIATPPGGMR